MTNGQFYYQGRNPWLMKLGSLIKLWSFWLFWGQDGQLDPLFTKWNPIFHHNTYINFDQLSILLPRGLFMIKIGSFPEFGVIVTFLGVKMAIFTHFYLIKSIFSPHHLYQLWPMTNFIPQNPITDKIRTLGEFWGHWGSYQGQNDHFHQFT